MKAENPGAFERDRLGPTEAYEELLQSIQRLEEVLGQQGISISQESRLAQYRREVSKIISIVVRRESPMSLNLSRLHRAVYEVPQLAVAVEEFSRTPEVSGWKAIVHKALRGDAIPRGRGPSQPRDIQFELYTAALCRRAGYEIRLAEPDVVIQDGDLEFSIAAKRPQSLTRLRKTIRKANNQIKSANLPGIIALDLTVLYNPQGALLLTRDPKGALGEVKRIADEFVNRNASVIRQLVDTNVVFGLMVFMGALSFRTDLPQLGSASRWTVVNLCDSNHRLSSILATFTRKLGEVVQ